MRLPSMCLPALLACWSGCPETPEESPSVPTLDGTLSLSVDPPGPLRRGETATLKASASSSLALDNVLVTFELPTGAELIAGSPIAKGAIQPSKPLETTVTVRIADDELARRIRVAARALTEEGRAIATTANVEANSAGVLRSFADGGREGPLAVTFTAQSRLRPGADVPLVLAAQVRAAHPRFELSLSLPTDVTVVSGMSSLGPRAVAVGELIEIRATIRLAPATASVSLLGFGRFGKPGDADHLGGVSAILEDAP